MGRLIDADKLKAQIEAHEIIKKFSITEYGYCHNTGLEKAEDEVDLAETVDAIPVEWIEKYIDGLHNNREIVWVVVVRMMLSKWRKEQNDRIQGE